MFTLLRNTACVEHGGRTLPACCCLTLPCPPLKPGLPPSVLHKHWEHSPRLRLSWNCLEPGQVNRDFARLRIPPWFPSHGGSPVFPSAKAPSHRPQRGLWERPGQARAWGCQGREKGLGLNENLLPDCNDFIPYLLLSAIQSLSYFYPAEAARSFLQWLFKEQRNHWTVWEYFQQGMVLHASEGNGKIARRLWEHKNYSLVAFFVTFPLPITKSPSQSSSYLLPLILRSLHSGFI